MIQNSFKVSVIIPVYNAERFVRRAVESAVEFDEVGEIILIDDAGPDNSFEVCRQLEKEYKKIILIRHPDHKNHGAGASRNLGIEHARFDYIAFLDADDYYLPNRFEKDSVLLGSQHEIDGVYGGIGVDYESDEARQEFLDAGYGYQEFLSLTGSVPPEELIEVLFHSHPRVAGEFSTIAITVRKSLFGRSGVFDTKLRLLQDIHLWRRMAAVGRLAAGIIDKPVSMRGVHDANRMIDRAEKAKYVDYWWEDLNNWFRSTQGIPARAQKAFKRAYCLYRIKNRSIWEARRVFFIYVLQHPCLVLQPMGFFDLNLFETFGRNWFTLHLTSGKNRLLRLYRIKSEIASEN